MSFPLSLVCFLKIVFVLFFSSLLFFFPFNASVSWLLFSSHWAARVLLHLNLVDTCSFASCNTDTTSCCGGPPFFFLASTPIPLPRLFHAFPLGESCAGALHGCCTRQNTRLPGWYCLDAGCWDGEKIRWGMHWALHGSSTGRGTLFRAWRVNMGHVGGWNSLPPGRSVCARLRQRLCSQRGALAPLSSLTLTL